MQASSPWQSGNFVKDLFIIFLNFEPTLASFGQNLNVCGQILQKILTSGRTVFDILFVILGESWYPYSVHQGHGRPIEASLLQNLDRRHQVLIFDV